MYMLLYKVRTKEYVIMGILPNDDIIISGTVAVCLLQHYDARTMYKLVCVYTSIGIQL